jgi:hypothetical protein
MNTTVDPDEAEVAVAVKRALLELKSYARSHRIDNALGSSVEALVAVGALSTQTADFISRRHAKFYGFNSSLMRHDLRVLKMVLKDQSPPVSIIGFADGSVSRLTDHRRNHAPAKKHAETPVVLKVDFQG